MNSEIRDKLKDFKHIYSRIKAIDLISEMHLAARVYKGLYVVCSWINIFVLGLRNLKMNILKIWWINAKD
jgi:hypothetical protein